MKANMKLAEPFVIAAQDNTGGQLVEEVIASNVVAGDTACDRQDLVEAEYYYRNAVNLAELEYGDKGETIAYVLTILADFYASQNRWNDLSKIQCRICEAMDKLSSDPDFNPAS